MDEQHILNTILTLGIGFILINVFVVMIIFTYQKKIRQKQTQLFQSIIDTEERERERIAKELHDGIGSNLSAIKLHFNHLFKTQNEDENISQLAKLINETTNEVRQVSHQMMPPLLKETGLFNSIQTLANRFKTSDLKIEVILLGEQKLGLSATAELMIYRIIQELINNSIKHGKSSEIEVQLVHSNNQLMVTVADNGIGYSSNNIQEGIGLKNIHSRISYLLGRLNVDSNNENGTVTSLYIPIRFNT